MSDLMPCGCDTSELDDCPHERIMGLPGPLPGRQSFTLPTSAAFPAEAEYTCEDCGGRFTVKGKEAVYLSCPWCGGRTRARPVTPPPSGTFGLRGLTRDEFDERMKNRSKPLQVQAGTVVHINMEWLGQ